MLSTLLYFLVFFFLSNMVFDTTEPAQLQESGSWFAHLGHPHPQLSPANN
jgi:hypothetical protein